jgi:predicted MPP superfamily phosphohydrolase
VFVTGDYVTRVTSAGLLRHILRPFGRLGTFGVLGNHDYWAGAEQVASIVASCGVTLLRESSERVDVDGRRVTVSGFDYPWGRTCQPPCARVDDTGLSFVLSHTADNIYRLSRAGATVVFSGHYHNGQGRIPGIGTVVVPSVYGRRFDHGHFVVNGTHLFVTAGVGAGDPPLRLYCRPDIFVVDVLAGEGKSRTDSPVRPEQGRSTAAHGRS